MSAYPVVCRVPSSDGTHKYNIRKRGDDEALLCECKGFTHRGKCRHLAEAVEALERGVRVVELTEGLFAEFDGLTMFLETPLPNGSTIRLTLGGDALRALEAFIREVG